MNKVINAYMGVCENCEHRNQTNSMYDDKPQVQVCYNCGQIKFSKQFNAREYIKELIEEGAEKLVEVEEVLTDRLSEVYDFLDFVDIELLGKMLAEELFDDVMQEVMEERAEANEYYFERQEAMMGAY